MTTSSILYAVLDLVLIIPAIILHEVSHGYVAYLLGDPTAKNAGRLTLNPIAHVDIYGTILLPLFMFLVAGFAIGYAKPVPINPYLMSKTDYKTGMLLTGAAGPLTNICLAIISGLLFRLVNALGAPYIVAYVFAFFTLINLVLAFFNLIPIPPLDGSRVVQRFLTGRALDVYNSIERYGILIVLVVVFVLPRLVGIDVLTPYLNVTVRPISQLLTGQPLI
jgi:Zn-dependent protease